MLWYKDAIVYGIDVKSFDDSVGDGIGDFDGVTRRLSYVRSLGVNCIWLLPFYPSPLRDNGYDVMDYWGVDARFGGLDAFKRFLDTAKELDFHVIVDMVANHTSDQHPWFQAARRDRNSPYRDYYVWADEPTEDSEQLTIFPTVENGVWTYDDAAGQYYWHYFYKFQPGLDHRNPKVRAEFREIFKFWLDLGIDGFRIDAAPLMISDKGHVDPRATPNHEILREMNDFVAGINTDAVLLGEANTQPERLVRYFGDNGDELHMLYNFVLNSAIFLALARQDASPIPPILNDLMLPLPPRAQWLNFLRNHDELSLERLTNAEREDVYKVFAPNENMRLYDRGIRRRLAPLFDNDRRRLELAFSLIFTLPGTPLFMWGDEIGMGDDLSLDERESVRTPMQWSNALNGGFSSAPADKLYRPVIKDGDYGYPRANVEDQLRDPNSLVNWVKRMIVMTRSHHAFGEGKWFHVPADDKAIMAHHCDCDDDVVLAVHNLSDKPCTARLDLDTSLYTSYTDVFGDGDYPPFDGTTITLNPYGYRWIVMDTDGSG